VDLRSAQPYQLLKNGIGEVFPPLRCAEQCDVAILGAGISGALVADELAANGLDVVVIDKRDAGSGSTVASTALIQYEIDTPLRRLIPLVGQEHATRAYRMGVDAIASLRDTAGGLDDCSFARRPSLFLAWRDREVAGLREECVLRREMGLDVEFLDGAELSRRFPFRPAAGLYSQDGAELDSYRLCHLLLKRAIRRGARVYDRTSLDVLERKGRGFRLRTDRGFDVTARHVVFCTGYESKAFIPAEETGCLHSTYVAVSEPVEDFSVWPERCLIWESGDPYCYLRTTADDRVLIGGLDDEYHSPTARDASVCRKASFLTRRFRTLFPMIPWETYCAWAGTFGRTKDGLAYIGEPPSLPGTYFVLGYGGNGITYSAMAAALARDHILGRKSPDAEIFRFGR